MSEPGPVLPFTVCYVLTGGAGSVYADMTAVSALSLLAQHPGTPIALLADEATARGIAASGGPLARHARLQVVPIPDAGDPVSASRSIKTRLREVMQGDLLFLDADTLVVRPIDPALAGSRSVRVAHDRYRPRGGPALQLSGWVEDLLVGAGWPRPRAYYNSGVMWLPDTPGRTSSAPSGGGSGSGAGSSGPGRTSPRSTSRWTSRPSPSTRCRQGTTCTRTRRPRTFVGPGSITSG